MTGKDADFDELGVVWRASAPDAGLVTSRLEARLKRQDVLTRLGVGLGLALGVLGLGLGVWTAWSGVSAHAWNFVSRGISLTAVGIVALLAARSLGGARSTGGSLRDMLDRSGGRSQRQAQAAGFGVLAVALLAVGGLVGYAIRVRYGHPPAMSPLEPLLALALLAVALLWIRQSQARAARTCRRLAEDLALDDA
jgi:hypothetical protein